MEATATLLEQLSDVSAAATCPADAGADAEAWPGDDCPLTEELLGRLREAGL